MISGGTWIDPITHRYPQLKGSLHVMQAALSRRFCEASGTAPSALAAVRAEQLVRWARYMLGTSRAYAARLLREAVARRRAVLRTPYFWTVAAALALPAALRERLARRDARQAPMSAHIG